MINITIVAVGKLKESYLKNGCAEYLKRLTPYAKVSVEEIAEEKCPDNPSAAEIANVVEKEGERILKKIPKGAFVASMCIEGSQISSVDFANKIQSLAGAGSSSIAFVIGGSFGLSQSIKSISKMKLSLSLMTLPHQLARMVLLEQIYRAFQISSNTKYHK